MAQIHENNKPFVCSSCPIRFNSKTEFDRHFVKVHGSNKPFQCPFCPVLMKVRFGNKSELKIHLTRVHEGKEFDIQDAYLTTDGLKNNSQSNQDISEVILPD